MILWRVIIESLNRRHTPSHMAVVILKVIQEKRDSTTIDTNKKQKKPETGSLDSRIAISPGANYSALIYAINFNMEIWKFDIQNWLWWIWNRNQNEDFTKKIVLWLAQSDNQHNNKRFR